MGVFEAWHGSGVGMASCLGYEDGGVVEYVLVYIIEILVNRE
jgi:hypothetical protein